MDLIFPLLLYSKATIRANVRSSLILQRQSGTTEVTVIYTKGLITLILMALGLDLHESFNLIAACTHATRHPSSYCRTLAPEECVKQTAYVINVAFF